MIHRKLLGMLFVLTLVAAACAPAAATEAPTIEVPTEAATATEAPAMTDTPAAADTPEATETEAAGGTGTAPVPVTGEATVNVAQDPTHGEILVNGEGFSLYLFMQDTQNSGTSTCTDADGCTTDWPPLLT